MEVNQQMNKEMVSSASGLKESRDTNDMGTVNKTLVIHVDTSEDSLSGNMRLVPIGVDSSPRAAAVLSSTKARPPPPFVLKVYDMVHDPETDSIISWNKEGTSFIVIDQHRFAAEVLKKYFRHNNFSSFICQLNTYCFKKISWDRLEFQNEWFRRGKKRWLKNIRRRESQNLHNHPIVDLDGSEMTKEFEDLRHQHNTLVAEIKELKAWHESAAEQIAVLKKQVQHSSSKRRKMVRFMAQTVWMLKKGLHGTEVAKKQRLEGPETEILMELEDDGVTTNKSDEGYRPIAQSDKEYMFLRVDSSMQNKGKGSNSNKVNGVAIPDVNSAEFVLLEKQLMEDINGENIPKQEITKLQSSMVIDLEDLIEGPADWLEYNKELIGKAKNLNSDS